MRSDTVIEEFRTQRVTVGTTAIRLGQQGSPKLFRGVWVKALSTNAGFVYVGMDDQAATNGWELDAGDEIHIPIDEIGKVWAEASEANQVVCLIFA